MNKRSLANLAALSFAFASGRVRTDFKFDSDLGLVTLRIDDDALSGGGGTDTDSKRADESTDDAGTKAAIEAAGTEQQQTQRADGAEPQGDGTGTDVVKTDPLIAAEAKTAVGDPPAAGAIEA